MEIMTNTIGGEMMEKQTKGKAMTQQSQRERLSSIPLPKIDVYLGLVELEKTKDGEGWFLRKLIPPASPSLWNRIIKEGYSVINGFEDQEIQEGVRYVALINQGNNGWLITPLAVAPTGARSVKFNPIQMKTYVLVGRDNIPQEVEVPVVVILSAIQGTFAQMVGDLLYGKEENDNSSKTQGQVTPSQPEECKEEPDDSSKEATPSQPEEQEESA